MKKDCEKRTELMKEIRGLVEKTFPNDEENQGIVYHTLNHNHQLKGGY